MIILITGASHTGKTLLAQRLLETHHYPVFSIDLLKMGLIRSGHTSLTPEADQELEAYLWPIVRAIIKTALENGQNLIVEGGYIPVSWREDFSAQEQSQIRFTCLIMSERYIREHFPEIKKYAGIIEHRGNDSWCTMEFLQRENAYYLAMCKKYSAPYVWIDQSYPVHFDL